MNPTDLTKILEFIKKAEALKNTLRSGRTSTGRQESVPDHTWRLCLLAITFHPYFPQLNFERLIKMCLIHDLGEGISGDIPAPQQVAGVDKSIQERKDLQKITDSLPPELKNEILSLFDEYEEVKTLEARLAKALDKMETIIQHNQGRNPEGFDYLFNVKYGAAYAEFDPLIAAFRKIIDADTMANS